MVFYAEKKVLKCNFYYQNPENLLFFTHSSFRDLAKWVKTTANFVWRIQETKVAEYYYYPRFVKTKLFCWTCQCTLILPAISLQHNSLFAHNSFCKITDKFFQNQTIQVVKEMLSLLSFYDCCLKKQLAPMSWYHLDLFSLFHRLRKS